MKRVPLPLRSFFLLVACIALAAPAGAANLRVMTIGLGTGTVTSMPAGINCGSSTGTCDRNTTGMVTLTAADGPQSVFAGWEGDCTGGGPMMRSCMVNLDTDRAVRARFNLTFTIPPLTDMTVTGIRNYLMTNGNVNTPARFLAALRQDFKQNWILMSRSESLQTGIARLPRFLLPSEDARNTFTFGMTRHSAYPGADPNAIEYMEWQDGDKNFHFHEIVLDRIEALLNTPPPPPAAPRPPRVSVEARDREIYPDNARCFQCHSTRNVLSSNGAPGTTGIPANSVAWKNKPNWDTYDSWGGMLPFNRDRIYKGSVEAAAFRKLFNLWNWRDNHAVRSFLEQLELQPSTLTLPASQRITRLGAGGANDGHIQFGFDDGIVTTEPPLPAGLATTPVSYSFDGAAGTSSFDVKNDGQFLTLHHSIPPFDDEGRGVEFFDLLGGLGVVRELPTPPLKPNLNQQRVAHEVVHHEYVTGSVRMDIRPLALAISNGCLTMANAGSLSTPARRMFFTTRNGMTLAEVRQDVERLAGNPESRTESIPRRKADIQKLNLDRTGDPYLVLPENGLIQQYGSSTPDATSTSVERLRQEVFRRRPNELGDPDSTPMGGVLVDRESYGFNTDKVALYRYFLEPLGVSVDKWSMSVRGRSRAYGFADVFNTYTTTLTNELTASLTARPFPGLDPPFPAPPGDCTPLFAAIDRSFAALPDATGVPKYSDVQRILNKACIECHGGLRYPPFDPIFDAEYLDLSEDETVGIASRLDRSWERIVMGGFVTANPDTSYLVDRIEEGAEKCPDSTATTPPRMPCGGPWLSKTDILTIRRWIAGPPAHANTVGDPHIRTVDGTNYDFQSAGEFVVLRGEGMEIQARQSPVPTNTPLGPDAHSGLSSCVSLNTAVAVRVGRHRISYQPNVSGEPDPNGLQLRIDGKLTTLGERGVVLSGGGRVLPTTARGIQIELPGGTDVIVTPGFWEHHQLWYLNIDVRHARATEGVMGTINPGGWLPALPDGTLLGPRPADLAQRHQDLYVTFADAWRVTDQTSLFDYARGTSTRTFTLRSWPGFEPQSCLVPQSFNPRIAPPLPPLPAAVARQHCAPIVAPDQRKNCEQDVMVTGEVAFARTYLAEQTILTNALPAAPVLLFPGKNGIDLASTVSFRWNKTRDANDDRVTYLQCIWPTGDVLTFNHCRELPRHLTILDGYNVNLLLLLLAILLALLILLFLRYRRARILAGMLLLLVLVAVILLFYYGRATTLTHEVTLQPGRTYFWKVIAQDGKGGTVESETRRLATKR